MWDDPADMRLIPVRDTPDAAPFLYRLLEERPRENWISHKGLPTQGEHEAFVHRHSFRCWYIIERDGAYVGALEVTYRNEIGVSILKAHQRQGLAKEAMTFFMQTHKPLPAIPAERSGNWLANIAMSNIGSKIFFSELGFFPCQETWSKE